MFDESYSDTVIDHFMSPRNAGTMPDADAEGSWGDPDCGDYLTLYLKVTDCVICEISFLVFGCPAAVASSSMTTVLAKGKTLKEAEAITEKEIADALGGLPEHKLHCSVLGATALRNAIDAYRRSHPQISENKS
ncbi:MAG: iron-sulfur cluster assembly scaffold protein [Eubacteriales bacterium]|jgi:nitrogen fixation NifU-like protein|nr:iron-sulfur cluster assembly scaffold protein [Eubacteriales bacterium]MDD4445754.1 iron-sulfur cluster assembly scaffold protein [Eubacteriales bacterium]